MKKFKIKNRRKRKYVKKSDLAASFSTTQSLTVGLVPLILMAVSFFVTVLIYNPKVVAISFSTIEISAPTLPEVSIPTIELPIVDLSEIKFAMPEIPQLSIPSLPKITFSNPLHYVAFAGSAIISTVESSVQSSLQAAESARVHINSLGELSVTLSIQIANFLDPGPTFAVLGDLVLFFAEQTGIGISYTGNLVLSGWNAITYLFTTSVMAAAQSIDSSLTATFKMIESLSLSLQKTAVDSAVGFGNWATSVLTATIQAWNAFVWFVGTPFRAIHHYGTQLSIFMTPYLTYLGEALNRASADLEAGGESLIQGTNYVTNTVDQTSAQNK